MRTQRSRRAERTRAQRSTGHPNPCSPIPFPNPVVHLRNVRYTYPDGRVALDGVSFDIPAGQTVALVGPSGGGKSTIAQLLLGFITPDRRGDQLPIATSRAQSLIPDI